MHFLSANSRFLSLRLTAVFLIGTAACSAQMTKEQKIADFSQLAGVYAINYGPLQWKRDALQVDLLNIHDWLARAANTADDLDFYELCVAYVAALNDAHDAFLLPSDFEASLGFSADIYERKVLVDSINRKRLSQSDYPFQVGDEIVSIDGIGVQDLIASFAKYAIAANAVSTARVAAEFLTYRSQDLMPHAHTISDSAVVVIKRVNGDIETYSIPWRKTGSPVTLVGPVISPSAESRRAETVEDTDYMQPLRRMRNMRMQSQKAVRGVGVTQPVFTLPDSFKRRLGGDVFDLFYSGVFQAQGLNLGYIRIPSFDGGDFDSSDFQTEIGYMQRATDGLILDITRNPGGDVCFAEDLLSRVNPSPFRTVGLEIRATRSWVLAFQQALEAAMALGADAATVQQLQNNLSAVEQAFHQPSGRTAPLPVCGSSLDLKPAQDRTGQVIAYTKPIMLLTDEFTSSAGDLFAAVMQDNKRAVLFGARTMGAGGNVNQYEATTYSEGTTFVTESLMSRSARIITPDFPPTIYIENVGVRPDIARDYMTSDNLLNNGATFVTAFTDAMVSYIQSNR